MSSPSSLVYAYASPSEVLAASIVLPVMGIIAVVARFIARSKKGSFIGTDDVTICLALICVVGMGIIILYGNVKRAIGYPTPPSGDQFSSSESYQGLLTSQLAFFFWIPNTLSLGLIRTSVLFFYRRIFVVHSRSLFDIISRILLIIVALWTLVFFFMFIFYCGLNFQITHKATTSGARCLSFVQLLIGFTISDLSLDLMVWSLPMPIIWRLNTSRTKKCLISGVFLLAASSLVVAIIRLIVQAEQYAPDPSGNGVFFMHADIDQTETQSLYWSLVETGIAVIAACLPIIHSLFPPHAFKSLAGRMRASLSYPASFVRTSKRLQSSNAERTFTRIIADERRGGRQKSVELTKAAGYF